jgi:hypothetical protein
VIAAAPSVSEGPGTTADLEDLLVDAIVGAAAEAADLSPRIMRVALDAAFTAAERTRLPYEAVVARLRARRA